MLQYVVTQFFFNFILCFIIAYCGITTKQVRTFDNDEYVYSVSHSWHLAAQDCSGQRQVAMLTRLSPSNTTVV